MNRGTRHGWLMARHEAQKVTCPACHAPPGEVCTHPDGVPLGASPAHSQRLTAAEKENTDR